MFTGDLSPTSSTETFKAVSVKSASEMYSSLASAITSVTPKPGKCLSFDEDTNTYNVDISETIENNPDTVPTTKALFDTLVNKEDYIKNTIEISDVIEEIGDYNYNSITDTSTSNSGNYVGICYRP